MESRRDNEIGHDFEELRMVDFNDKIDIQCDAFEAAIKARRPIDIDRLLDGSHAEHRQNLLYELLLVAVEYAAPGKHSVEAIDLPHEAERGLEAPSTLAEAKLCSNHVDVGPSDCLDPMLRHVSEKPTTLGDYELLEEIGRGGMGVVYRAYQRGASRYVALKLIRSGPLLHSDRSHNSIVGRFRTEVQAAARLNHPNVVPVYDVGSVDDRHFYAMRFVDGQSLAQIVQAGPLPQRRVASYMVRVAKAVNSVHSAGILHRDLKPSNILIDTTTDQPLVSDFGLAKLSDGQLKLTLSGEIFGSPPYMSPEQVLNPERVTSSTDIYSLGATLYHLLTGRPPFQAASVAETAAQVVAREPIAPRKLNPSISLDVDTICLKCLEKDVSKRYSSAGDLADDLQRFLDGRPVVARPIRWPSRIVRWARRNPIPSALTLVIAVTLALGSATSTIMFFRAAESADAERLLSADLRTRLIRQSRKGAQSAAAPPLALPYLAESIRLDSGNPRGEWWDRVRFADQLEKCGHLRFLGFHQKLINCLDFNSAGTQLISASDDGEAILWDVTTGATIAPLQCGGAVTQATFSQSGQYALTATMRGDACLWDTRTAALLGTCRHDELIGGVAFSANDELFVTASYDSTARVWNRADCSCVATLDHPKSVLDCAFIADDQLVTLCADGIVYLWNSRGGAATHQLSHRSAINVFAVSPCRDRIVTGAADGTVSVWKCETGELCFDPLVNHGGKVLSVAFATTGKTFVTAGSDRRAIICDSLTGQILNRLDHERAVRWVSYCADDQLLATSCADNGLYLWDSNLGQRVFGPLPHAGSVSAIAVARNGALIASSGQENGVRLWDFSMFLHQARKPASPLTDCQLAFDRSVMLAADQSGNIFMHDLHAKRVQAVGNQAQVRAIRFVANTSRCIAASADGSIVEWNVDDGRRLREWNHGAQVDSLAICQGLCATTGGGFVKLWDYDSLRLVEEIPLDSSTRGTVFMSRDAQDLFVTDGAVLHQWRRQAGRMNRVRKLTLSSRITYADLCDDGQVALVCVDGSVVVCPVHGGRELTRRNMGMPTFVRFDSTGSRILVGRDNGIAQPYDSRTLNAVTAPLEHAAAVISGDLSNTGNEALTLSSDGFMHLWDLTSGELILKRFSAAREASRSFFCGGDAKVAICRSANDVSCELIQGVSNSVDELFCWSELMSGKRLDSIEQTSALAPDELAGRWRSRRPIRFGPRTDSRHVTSATP